mgnify:CR=1 FL=1
MIADETKWYIENATEADLKTLIKLNRHNVAVVTEAKTALKKLSDYRTK